jgi:septin family protein
MSHCQPIRRPDGRETYGREYHWGFCDIQNATHSDFALLTKLLIGHFMLPSMKATKALTRPVEIKEVRIKEVRKESPLKRRTLVLVSALSVVTLGVLSLFRK